MIGGCFHRSGSSRNGEYRMAEDFNEYPGKNYHRMYIG